MSQTLPAPPKQRTADDIERRVGFELEFAGVEPDQVLSLIETEYGGGVKKLTDFEYLVCDTALGNFRLELDAEYLKRKGREATSDATDNLAGDWESWSTDLLSAAAQLVVPWEIVTDPIPLSKLHKLIPLCTRLRAVGAQGTRHSVLYAFGMHMNPELPNLSADTVLHYLQAFFCLYDWLNEKETVSITRKITPYIDPFPKEYVMHVTEKDYKPDLPTLIDDYLKYNATRNRSLDLLPLFAHLDRQRVSDAVDDPRIKPRPTLHYRLPNSDIDQSDWSLLTPWRDWLQVEFLADNPKRLRAACDAYMEDLGRLTRGLDTLWATESQKWLVDLGSV